MARRPARTVATEAWPPNVEVGRRRLEPLGVEVVAVASAPDNVDQAPGLDFAALPFEDASFSLVVSRHESYVASEIARILRPGGVFLTQQLGGATRTATGPRSAFRPSMSRSSICGSLARSSKQRGCAC